MDLIVLAVRRETDVLRAVFALAVLDSCTEEVALIPLGMQPSARSIVKMVRTLLSSSQPYRPVQALVNKPILMVHSTDNDKLPCTPIATFTLVLT